MSIQLRQLCAISFCVLVISCRNNNTDESDDTTSEICNDGIDNDGDFLQGDFEISVKQVTLFPIIPSITWNFEF